MPEPTATLSVATYNIHRSVGRDRRMDHRRIADVILDLDADVIALQEVATPVVQKPGAVVLLHRLCQHGYTPVLGPTMDSEHGTYGNVLLSRLHVQERRRHDLSRQGREPRGLIEASLTPPRVTTSHGVHSCSRTLKCFATHLGLSGRERRWQIGRVIEQIDQASRHACQCAPMILLGDFNEWYPRTGRLAPVNARLTPAPLRATYPGGWPLVTLDRIWYRGLVLQNLEVVRTGLARIASDHLPLRAVFQVIGDADGR